MEAQMNHELPRGWEHLDPNALAVATAISQALPVPLRSLGVETARQLLARPPSPEPLTALDGVEDIAVPTRCGQLRARRYHASHSRDINPRPALMYLHGGGFALGTLDGVDEVCRAI